MSFLETAEIDHSFRNLGPSFWTEVEPLPLPNSKLLCLNQSLVSDLGLSGMGERDDWRRLINGELKLSSKPAISTVYSGHQFGVWAGQLGDGRAHLLGAVNGQELQLKGSGLTPYSRQGDGRAVLRSTIREYLASEYLNAIGIPTTRALGIVSGEEGVQREILEAGAVLMRVSPSFVRFGHFEHFYSQGANGELEKLLDYTIKGFYPDIALSGEGKYSEFLRQVTNRTARLVAHWMVYGFCHGVMNTDNMSILGLTIDYGPYGFLETYDPDHICNDSDHHGRYRFSNQPAVAQWNLMALAYALQDFVSRENAEEIIGAYYPQVYQNEYWQLMLVRLALDASEKAKELCLELLSLLERKIDHNGFIYKLVSSRNMPAESQFEEELALQPSLKSWLQSYYQVRVENKVDQAMRCNPKLILKNWVLQSIIAEVEGGNHGCLQDFTLTVQSPYSVETKDHKFIGATPEWGRHLTLSCSS